MSTQRQVAHINNERNYDALVIGAGLAGSAIGIELAEAGRAVALLEKTAGAHPKVCGEFLSHEALHYLGRLGVDPMALGAVPIDHVRLVSQRTLATARLPFPALSLSRACLDEALVERARAVGVDVWRGQRAQTLTEAQGPVESAGAPSTTRWTAVTDREQSFTGRSAFLATGKHDMHGWNRPAGKQNDLLAFKMQWRLSSAQHADLERHVELILFPGGYAGLQPIEAGGANLCLLVRRGAYRAMGGNWLALLEHLRSHSRHLSDRLTGAAPLWAKPLSLSSIPYGYVRADAEADLWRLGDQSAVIPSFAGDGMSIALHSAALAAEIYKQGGNAREFQRRLHGEISRQVGLATWISRMLVHAPGSTMWLAGMWPGILAAVGDTTRIASRHLLR